ncbi:FAD/NAD(P)-binding domain-containing protein [Meredithblackwellia eburnea MCA 4105]
MAEELKNVVVVGFGLSGAGAVQSLAEALPSTHRLVVISATQTAYFPIASLRASVSDEWAAKVSLDTSSYFNSDSPHVLLRDVSAVKLERHSITLNKTHPEHGFGLEIPFEYAILAMGSSYPPPCRPLTSKSDTSSIISSFHDLEKGISSSKHVLCIGGGPVGIEMAGEVKARFKDTKECTLVHSGATFLPEFKPSLGESLKSQLEGLGVKVALNTRLDTYGLETGPIAPRTFDLGAAGVVEVDFIFIAFGNRPNVELVKEFDPSLLSEGGRIKVKPTFQLDASNSSLDHIFAIGDITDIDETKVWVHAQNHGPMAASNVLSLIAKRDSGNPSLKTYTPGSKIIVVSVGPNGGAGQIYLGVVVGAWATALAKSRTLFYSKFTALYKPI